METGRTFVVMKRTAIVFAVVASTLLAVGSSAGAVNPPVNAPRSPITVDYLPAGLKADPPPLPLTWDDFQESYLYESPAHDRWTVGTTGFYFEASGNDGCRLIPKELRPKYTRVRLDPKRGPFRVAVLSGGPELFQWLFSNEGVAFVSMPERTKGTPVSALIECSSGKAAISKGKLSVRSLTRVFRDATLNGALFMTNFASASKPEFFTQSFSGPNGSVLVSLVTDPRSQRGIEVAGTEHVTAKQRTALVERSGTDIKLTLIERERVAVVLQSASYPLEELVKIANGLTVSRA
jgi:hypothetical protein